MSKRTSGVKNFVSKIGVEVRVVPFIQPRSPTANGVAVSTSGAGGGAWSPSGTIAATAAEAAAAIWGEGAATGVPATAAGAAGGAAGGTFMTRSDRVAAPVTTRSEGLLTAGSPPTCAVTTHVPGGRSPKE